MNMYTYVHAYIPPFTLLNIKIRNINYKNITRGIYLNPVKLHEWQTQSEDRFFLSEVTPKQTYS